MEHQLATKSTQKEQAKNTPPASALQTKLVDQSAMHPVLRLQRAVGNLAVQSMVSARHFDRQAQQSSPNVELTSTAPASVHNVLKSPGQPLAPTTRSIMEAGFGQDFSHVRIHTDSKAAESARHIDALAYTVGSNVVFGKGQYAPDTTTGKRLIAHELAHVVQQDMQTNPFDRPLEISKHNDSSEQEANKASDSLMIRNQTLTSPLHSAQIQVQRQVKNDPGLPTSTEEKPEQKQQEPVKSAAPQQQTQAAKDQQAMPDELSATFGFFTPRTYAQLLSLSKLSISQLRQDMEDLQNDPRLLAEAEEWIQGIESWLPAMERRGNEPLDQFSTAQALLWGKELRRLLKEIKASKELQENRLIRARLARARETLAEAESKIKEERIKLNEEIRMTFREGDESKLAKVTDIAGTALDIGLSLHELSNMMREALVEMSEKEVPGEVTYTMWLVRVNKFLAAVNMLYSLTHLDAPTEWGSAMKGIESVSSTYASLITLFGLPAHMALYADLYLVPLTRIVLARADFLVSKYLQELNIVSVHTGFSVEMSTYPGGWPMFNFMVQVKRADSPEEIPAIPKEVEKYLLKQRELIQAGTRKFTESESEPSKVHSELPTTGWWFWRELDTGKIKSWIFDHRDELWIMFYGNIPVPERGTNYRPQ